MTEIEELKVKIEAEKQERADKFTNYLQEGAKKFNCSISALPQITPDGRITVSIQVIAND